MACFAGRVVIHNFARRAILDALTLAPADRLLDVGCGGGLLLRDNSDDQRRTPQTHPRHYSESVSVVCSPITGVRAVSSRARETASGRLATSSLRKMLLTWVLTVFNET